MTKEELLEKIRGKTVEEIENIFRLYSKDISELENGVGKSGYDITKFEILNTIIDTLTENKDIEKIDKILNNPNLQLNIRDRTLLTLKINNKEYTEQFLQLNKYALNSLEKYILEFATGNNKYFSTQDKEKNKFTIPSSLRHGIEIESRRDQLNWISTRTYKYKCKKN